MSEHDWLSATSFSDIPFCYEVCMACGMWRRAFGTPSDPPAILVWETGRRHGRAWISLPGSRCLTQVDKRTEV